MTEEVSEEEIRDAEVERFVLYTADSEELCQFTAEALNCAALDTCCTTSVAGWSWIKRYLQSLSVEDRSRVVGPLPGNKRFKGVSQTILLSQSKYIIPAHIGNSPVSIEVEVIDADIPLLLSKQAMKRAKMVLHMDKDYAVVFGQKVMLDTTTAGHYVLPLLIDSEANLTEDQSYKIDEIMIIDFSNASEKEVSQALH